MWEVVQAVEIGFLIALYFKVRATDKKLAKIVEQTDTLEYSVSNLLNK